MESAVRNLIYISTLIALVFSLAIPLYCIPTGLAALFRDPMLCGFVLYNSGAALLRSSP